MSWHLFPLEIKHQILQELIEDGSKLADFATVSREWQEKIEQNTFARIRLTPSRLAKFDSMTSRNRSLVRCLWLCLELDKYCCIDCAQPTWVFNTNEDENEVIMTALQRLFSVLSTWGSDSNLSLDISVYSPSDSGHWFPHLTFKPDIPFSARGHGQVVKQAGRARAADDKHDLNNVTVEDYTPRAAIDRVFGEIMNPDNVLLLPFTNEEQEDEWWQRLPLVPAVTSVLLRQQNRRRWKPRALAQMLSRLPMLRELYYEPWREWGNEKQESRDESYHKFLESLVSTDLRNLTIFENFNEKYAETFSIMDHRFKGIRTPSTALSRTLSKVRVAQLDIVGPHFATVNASTKPHRHHGHASTSRTRGHYMPKLKTMEIWNGREKLAALFKYELLKEDRSAIITWKGTWSLTLQPSVVETWEAVTTRRGGFRLIIVYETLDSDTIRSHGDAIVRLKVSERVVRPISLQQILIDCDALWTRTLPL
ncbi:hypothetical protein MKX08_010551 [Trichoderma sp. CBMAI-0020]|nr:hypothetical protein MKX08_010551 [Trichoderma sp. CBMAI-0020]